MSEGKEMNAAVMHNVEQELHRSIVFDGGKAELKTVEPLGAILKRIDDTDLVKAHNHYAQLLDQHTQEIVSRMHHRADMLRRRARQLDEEADIFQKKQDEISRRNFTLMEDIDEIENILRSLAHIEPQRTG